VDECVPLKLVRMLADHQLTTVLEMGWGSYSNGRLLALAETQFDLFLTCDRNLEYQQNLKGRKISVILLSTNHWPALRKHAALVQAALNQARPADFLSVAIPSTL
jgi:hypothetical protein